MEVIKTRLQLDGELQSRGRPAVLAGGLVAPSAGPQANASGRVYSSPLDCAKKTFKFEGIRGVQRGLGAAVSHPFALPVFLGPAKELRSTPPAVHVSVCFERISVRVLRALSKGYQSGRWV